MPNEISLIKCDQHGVEVWRYPGRVLELTPLGTLAEAAFNREDLAFHGLIFKRNDRFLELYLIGRWFNIFEIHDRDTDEIKAWYCNVTRPADFRSDGIAYDDLALDLLVFPDGRQLVLDEDEFQQLCLSREESHQARMGLEQLQELFKNPALFSFEVLLGRDGKRG
jgi:uncharacterized protein